MLYKRISISISSLLLILGLILACSSSYNGGNDPTDDNGGNDPTDDNPTMGVTFEQGRSSQVTALYDNQIEPSQSEHLDLIAALQSSGAQFEADPTLENLNALKSSWLEAFLQWKNMEIFNIGVVQSSFAHSRIHQWPVNTDFIEDNIATEPNIDSDYISSIGATSKGYGAIEYLLFSDEESAILDSLTTGPNFESRLDYLIALIDNLLEEAQSLEDLWEATENSFKTSLESGVNGSQNEVINAIIAGLETIKLRKLPPTSETPITELEAFYSLYSKEAIAENLKILRETYTGDFQGEGYGMEEFMEEVLDITALNTTIEDAFQESLDVLDTLENGLEDAVENDDMLVEDFRDTVTALIALFKTDVSSAANIVVTFNDNDGD